jgi:hypothetical protein
MVNSLKYKKNANDVMERLRLLYDRKAPDQIFASFELPSVAISDFAKQYPNDYDAYPEPEVRIEFWDKLLSESTLLEDDSIPSAYLSEMDQGLYGALIGGEIQFMCHHETGWISSMVRPLFNDLTEFKPVFVSTDHLWLRHYLKQLSIFKEKSWGKFGISHFILVNGLNFIFELIGATKTYLALFEHPDLVRQAIDFGFEINLGVQKRFFDLVPEFNGGTFSNMVQWIPGRIVSESIDPFHMTSVNYFEKWGREPVERMFKEFDGGVLHIHANGRHLLEAACSLKGLKAIKMSNDVGLTPSFELIHEFRKKAGDLPLVIDAPYDHFIEELDKHQPTGGVFYQVIGAPDVDTVNRIMEKVRVYRL